MLRLSRHTRVQMFTLDFSTCISWTHSLNDSVFVTWSTNNVAEKRFLFKFCATEYVISLTLNYLCKALRFYKLNNVTLSSAYLVALITQLYNISSSFSVPCSHSPAIRTSTFKFVILSDYLLRVHYLSRVWQFVIFIICCILLILLCFSLYVGPFKLKLKFDITVDLYWFC